MRHFDGGTAPAIDDGRAARVIEPSDLDLLGGQARAAVEARLRRLTAARGAVLFNEGDLGTTMYVVASGRVELQVSTFEGHTLTLHVVQPGEVFGEVALVVDDHRRTSRAKVLEDGQLWALGRRDFDQLRAEYAEIDRLLVAVLARRVQRTTVQALEMKLPPELRVWRRLAALATAYAGQPIHLTQQGLAELAGTVRQTANRVLREGADHGILAVQRQRITILDADRLTARARG